MPSRLPQVDKILRDPELEDTLALYRRDLIVIILREIMDELRDQSRVCDCQQLAGLVKTRLKELLSPSLSRVINGSGVVLNTNLGRAPISALHLEYLKTFASSYCNLEIDLETGKRGKRSSRLEKLLQVLCGSQAALAVNNNAAALVLAVSAFASNKEVVVSRGELIEIGGSFRLPDMIESSGGRLKEVGSTNKTRLADYSAAIGPETGLVMRCHRSNFEILGFTEETKIAELSSLCKSKSVVFLEDLGSGALINLEKLGLADEPTVKESLESGCDLVCFSGDKLLGGPQAGIICGRKDLIEIMHKHPLYRALRLDKIKISLLEQTLQSYFLNDVQNELPVLGLSSSSKSLLEQRANEFKARLANRLENIKLETIETESTTGGGSLPGKQKASAGLSLTSPWKSSKMALALRRSNPPVLSISREKDNVIDFRTILPEDEKALMEVLLELDKAFK